MISEVTLASKSIHAAVYSFTSSDIAQGFVDAARNPDLDIQVLTERSTANTTVVRNLIDAGVDVRYAFKADCSCGNVGSGIMHHKFTIIDGQTVLNGSFNYSCTATYCSDENIVVSHDTRLAEDFEAEFHYLFENGEPAL